MSDTGRSDLAMADLAMAENVLSATPWSTVRWTVIIPVKRLEAAKSRLRPELANVPELALAFAMDTVAAAVAASNVAEVIVVTSDARVLASMKPLGVTVVDDPGPNLNAAIAAGIERASGCIAVITGDLPALRPADLAVALALAEAADRAMVAAAWGGAKDADIALLVVDAKGGMTEAVQAIVEHKDATPALRAIREVYTGILAAPTALLARWVMALNNNNVQGEFYLTDVVAMAVADGVPVVAIAAPSDTEVLGVNSPVQLADLERRFQRQQAEALLEAGVRLADPARLDVRGRLHCGSDVEIDVNCIFEGDVQLGDGVRIGANCVVRDTRIEAGAVIHPFSHLEGALVGAGALVGPFARLRPGAMLGAEVHIGNFVEVKNSTLARGAKANHLAYLGDATVGERVNFGAGSITANYDGANKHRTVIGNDVHVGSNCVLVAPLALGDGATIGGGSTISKDVPAGQMTVARARQAVLPGWQRPKKSPG